MDKEFIKNPVEAYEKLKQECEKLKNWVKNMMFDTDRNDWFEHFVECFENWKEDLFKQLDQIKAENEELKKDLHQNLKEKDKLHLIIDRLLEASGYDTNIASAEDFEDVYENMHYEKQQLDQLKQTNEDYERLEQENEKLKQALEEIVIMGILNKINEVLK